MQIVEKKAEGLSRTFGVLVTAADIAGRLDKKIAEIAPQVQLKGFRKGKVPASHVRKMFGQSIMGDLVNDLVQEGVNKAVEQNAIRPASSPEIAALENVEAVLKGGADLAFDVAVEAMPEFEPMDVRSISIVKPVAEVTDEEIDTRLATLAEGNKTYTPKKGKAAKDDSVTMNFVGKVDGVAFDGGTAEGATVVIGSGQLIPGFEDQLIGAKAGDERLVKVTFPAEYGAANLAGKDATFDVTVTEVQAPGKTVLDDEFAKRLGLSTMDALREAVKSQIANELSGLSRAKAKRSLLDALDNAHVIDLPAKMVAAEFDAIWGAVQQDREAGNVDPDDEGKSDDELKVEYRGIAERRVRLGLVLAEIGRRNNVEVRDEEVARAINMEAMRYPGQEKQIIDFYRQNPNAMAQVRAPLYEEKVVDFVLELAKIETVTVSRAALEADDDTPVVEEKPAKKPAAKKTSKKAEADAEAPSAEAEAKPAKKPAAKKAAKKADAE